MNTAQTEEKDMNAEERYFSPYLSWVFSVFDNLKEILVILRRD